MAPNSKAPPAIMKQGTLSFASSKRGAAATASGKANVLKKTPSIGIVKPPAAEKKVVGSRTVSTDSSASALTVSSTSTLSDDDDVVVLSTAQRAPKRLRTASGASKPTSSTTKHAAINDSSSEDEAEPITPKGSLQVLEKSGQLNKLYGQAREKNNYLPLSKRYIPSFLSVILIKTPQVHAEKQTNVHHILRVFDKYVSQSCSSRPHSNNSLPLVHMSMAQPLE